eukprot:11447928-Alexandrium_andersonii.AAC.1
MAALGRRRTAALGRRRMPALGRRRTRGIGTADCSQRNRLGRSGLDLAMASRVSAECPCVRARAGSTERLPRPGT